MAALLMLLVFAVGIEAQVEGAEGKDEGPALRLMAGNAGIAIGHVPRVDGLRINWSDRYLDEINGLNLTLWQADGSGVGGRVNGLAMGAVPQAGTINGVGIGLGAVVAEERMRGVHLGGLALVGGEDFDGIGAGGLAVVGGETLRGVQAGGLALVAGESVGGIQAGGLALVAGGRVRGIQAGGLAVVAGGSLTGMQGGGLAVVAGDHMDGIQFGGLALVAGDRMKGVQVGGLANVAGCSMIGVQIAGGALETGRRATGAPDDRSSDTCTRDGVNGVSMAGVRVRGAAARGFTAAGGWIEVDELKGVSVAGYQRSGIQVGLAVGLVNWTDHLQGVQLGLLNRAANNPAPFRILPLVNLHF